MSGLPFPPATRRTALRLAITGVSSVAAAGMAVAAAATLFARRVVTPAGYRPDDVDVLAVEAESVTLRVTPETVAPGRYGIWLDGGAGHARVGTVLDHDEAAGTVTRQLDGVDSGRLRAGRARWNQFYFAGTPTSALGLEFREIEVAGADGPLPCWLVPAGDPASGGEGGTWAVLVHGRGATREEALRALPVLRRLGITALVVSYGTSADLPTAAAGRYHLGDREWLDVEAAVLHAVRQGAGEIVLFGWSMGGAMAMQAVSRSWTADRVRAVVLDSPVIDWRDVLLHHARLNRLPEPVGRLGQTVLSHRSAWRLAGTEAPVDLDRLDWVTRAAELAHPTLLIHSDDDEFVPSGPSRRLADARPDLVTYVDVPGARHTKEWNVDPEAWDAAVAAFLLRL